MFDEIDRAILRHLTAQGRATHRELGQAVGLSPNAAAARVARLRDQGVITGFTAIVDHARLGRGMEASIDVWLGDDTDGDGLAALALDDDRIVEAFHPTGPLDYRLRVRVESTEDLTELIDRLKHEAGVRQTDTRLVLVKLPTAHREPAG